MSFFTFVFVSLVCSRSDWRFGEQAFVPSKENRRVSIEWCERGWPFEHSKASKIPDWNYQRYVGRTGHPSMFLYQAIQHTRSIAAGYINVYNGSESKPFISAFDPKPIPVKYISFAGHDTDTGVEFLYNCSSTSEILATTTEPPTVSTENSASSLTDADISGKHLSAPCPCACVWCLGVQWIVRSNSNRMIRWKCSVVLAAKCQVVESWEHIYDDFIPLSSIQKKTRKNNTFRMELFVVASRDAHIMLSSNDKVNVTTDDVYEIGKRLPLHVSMRSIEAFHFIWPFCNLQQLLEVGRTLIISYDGTWMAMHWPN